MRRIRIPLLTRAMGEISEGATFVGDWQEIPPKLSQASLVVEVAAARTGGAGLALSLEAPDGDEAAVGWFGPVSLLSPGSHRYALEDTSLPTELHGAR
jgi:hypothetical protein